METDPTVTEQAASMAIRGAIGALMDDGKGRSYLDLQRWLTSLLDAVYREAGR